jgi:hypothetical protein
MFGEWYQKTNKTEDTNKFIFSSRAQLDKVTHETTTSGAHRPPTFTVHDYNTTITAFQVTHKEKGRSLRMACICRNM